ncbi:MAG TPA: MmgE/PrpD family protein [Devosia sp.]|jgi:2-methylcitrate dehydratase PrpD|nr:MmgE/PrpD family protein [Devosia sp.]
MSLTRSVTERYLRAAGNGVDRPALEAARIALADALSVMVAATGLEPAVQPFMTYASASGSGPSTLIGQDAKVSPLFAALANGALAHAIDYEDTFAEGMIHPSASLVPALLALAESEDSSGDQVLTALALGCDFSCRASLALDGDPATRGWYHPPILAGLGATLGSALLLKLNADGIRNALGLFILQFMLGDELKRSPRSDLRAVREGFAARAAVEAALLARAGVEAVEAPLEGPSGLFAMLTGKPPRDEAFATVGAAFHGPDVGIKRWPSCRGTHNAVLAAQAFRDLGFAGADIATVRVQVGPPNDMLFVPRAQRVAPQTAIDGKFSIPFVFASVMQSGDLTLASFTPEQLRSPGTLALAGRVTMADEPVPKGSEAIYMIETGAGAVHSEVIDTVPVCRARDISLSDLAPKLQACFRFGSRLPNLPAFLAEMVRLESQPIVSLMRLL